MFLIYHIIVCIYGNNRFELSILSWPRAKKVNVMFGRQSLAHGQFPICISDLLHIPYSGFY